MTMADQDTENESTATGSPHNLDVPFANRKTLRSSIIKHASRAKSPGRKTVSFSSRNSDKKISNVSDCWNYMQTGSEFVKLRGTNRQFRRFFSLDADLSHIRWSPTNKKPHKARIAIDDIREIRLGKNTELLRSSEDALSDLQEECLFSIIYGDDYETLDLIASSGDDANIWVTGLMALTSNKFSDDCKPSSSWATLREQWLEAVFDEFDLNKVGFLDEKTTMKAIKHINPRVAPQRVKNKIKELNSGVEECDRGKIAKPDFVELYKEIGTRPEVYFLMVRYANKDYLSCQDLRLFLETEQGMVGVTTDFCENLIEQYEPAPEAKENNLMTVDGFTAFLLSHDCTVFDPSHTTVVMDMRQPFARYFIASSQKSFLVEDQQGPASPDGFASALKRNCRLIEMDIWDPSESKGDKEPLVQNGPLAHSKVPLSTALRTIREHAFERSRYPLLLHVSVHCSLDWQKVAAKLIVTHLGTKLYLPSADPTNWGADKAVPSPYDFQNRILILGKKLVGDVESGEVSEEEDGVANSSRRKGRRLLLCKELSDLVPTFLNIKSINDLMATAPGSTTMNPARNVPTLPEATCLRLMHTYASEFGQTTRDYCVRVSPNASRIDSSNLNPQEFWNNGVQMVCLNYQTPGLMMDLQEGKFSENGACGYVLKPSIMKDELFVPGEKIPAAPQILHLRVLSGQQLPRPRGSNAKGDSSDPFVVIEVFGLPGDCAEERTRTIRNDSNNPSFDESFQFQVCVPELALVRFLVLDDDYIGDDFIGQYTIPFECLQPGYRHISLLNNEGDPLENATLFVHIAITNRRGGGKAKKRGMSVKRKNSRVSSGMKLVGIKFVDDQFKVAVAPLAESIAMRNRLEGAMVDWQEECGLGPAGTIRQGIRLIHSRMITLAVNSSPPSSPSPTSDASRTAVVDGGPYFFIDSDDHGYPLIMVNGNLPEQLQRTFQKLKTLIGHCVNTLSQADLLLSKIEESIRKISECHEELARLCIESGLKGQKATRAAENFTWNLRLLKAQLNLMNKSQEEAQDVVTQVFDTGGVLGILSDKLMSRRNGRRFSRVVADPLKDSVL